MGMISPHEIKDNYQRVVEKIHRAAERSGRTTESVKLVVVTKAHPIEAIDAVIKVGAGCLGENYIEEALPKITALSHWAGIEWHMIGHVQSRKAGLAAENFSFIHSLDSVKLAARLNRFAGEFGRQLPCLLECNVSGEESKFGFPAWRESDWDGLLPEFEQIAGLPNLEVRGLMTIAPYDVEADSARSYFKLLGRMLGFLRLNMPNQNWAELSMGMSGDFEVAIEEGSTIVRIGTSIFGPRQ
jgi:hypothetical protein